MYSNYEKLGFNLAQVVLALFTLILIVWLFASLYLCVTSPQWPALYFVPVVAAVTASLPGALISGLAPANVRHAYS